MQEVAGFATNLPVLDFMTNHHDKADIAIFDFSAIKMAASSAMVLERQGYTHLLKFLKMYHMIRNYSNYWKLMIFEITQLHENVWYEMTQILENAWYYISMLDFGYRMIIFDTVFLKRFPTSFIVLELFMNLNLNHLNQFVTAPRCQAADGSGWWLPIRTILAPGYWVCSRFSVCPKHRLDVQQLLHRNTGMLVVTLVSNYTALLNGGD